MKLETVMSREEDTDENGCGELIHIAIKLLVQSGEIKSTVGEAPRSGRRRMLAEILDRAN